MEKYIRISSKTRQTYLPKDIVDSGFEGSISIIPNVSTIVLVHPKASLDDVEKSLKIILKDVELRKEMKSKEVDKYEV